MPRENQVKVNDINKKCHPACKKNDKICPKLLENTDSPCISEKASLGFRLLYSLVAWFMLGQAIAPGNPYFISIILFITPLFMDYLKFTVPDKPRKRLRTIEIILCLLWIIIGILGASNILTINIKESIEYIEISEKFIMFKGEILPVKYLWCTLGLNVGLTIIDFFIFRTKYEEYVMEFNGIAG